VEAASWDGTCQTTDGHRRVTADTASAGVLTQPCEHLAAATARATITLASGLHTREKGPT